MYPNNVWNLVDVLYKKILINCKCTYKRKVGVDWNLKTFKESSY